MQALPGGDDEWEVRVPLAVASAARPRTESAGRSEAQPFLKWAGGKRQLLDDLLARVPERIDSYYEPFLGGGALFFKLAADPERRPRRAVLNDLNPALIATYRTVRDEAGALIEALDALARDYLDRDKDGREAYYYATRERYRELSAREADDLDLAVHLLFLNRTAYAGLHRLNSQGHFNTPHGKYPAPRILSRDVLLAASAALHDVELCSADFETVCAGAGAGSLVYSDPPYLGINSTSRFTAYTSAGFDRDDQLRLKRCLDALVARGVQVLLSNSSHPWLRQLYDDGTYLIERVDARRAINSRTDRRGPIAELLISAPRGRPVGSR